MSLPGVRRAEKPAGQGMQILLGGRVPHRASGYAPHIRHVLHGLGNGVPSLTREGRQAQAAKHRKALRRYQQEIQRGSLSTALDQFAYLEITPIGDLIQWAPRKPGQKNRLMMSAFITRSSGGGGGGGSPTEFQGLTPTVQVDTVGELGTELASGTAGTIIGGLPSVLLHSTGGSPYRSNVPGWHPANSGTSGSPIIIVGKYDPTTMLSPLTDSNRFELRAGSGSYNGSDSHPVFGANSRSYVRWLNIVCDESNCVTKPDNGPAYIAGASSAGVWIDHCVIRGNPDPVFASDNHTAIRVGEAGTTDSGHVITNNKLYNFNNGFGENAAAIITYGGQAITIEHNEIWDCTAGIYIKGTSGSGANFNYGSYSYNDIHGCAYAIRVQEVDASNDTLIEHNLCRDTLTEGATIILNDFSPANVRRVVMRRNSLIQKTSLSTGLMVEAITGSGCQFNDNIVAFYTTTNLQYMNGGGYTANNFAAYDYNGFFGSTNGNPWSWNGGNITNISGLHSAIANSNNNQVLAGDPFVNHAADNYAVTGGALTASSTGGPIGAEFSMVGPQ
jgi:hypothetical protein